jgi:hypothetical protein
VLLDSIGRSAPRRAFAAEAPSELIDGDVELALMLRPRQLERRGHRRTTAADYRNFDGFRATHRLVTKLKCAYTREDAI